MNVQRFPLAVMNTLFKTIFWVSLLYWLKRNLSPGRLEQWTWSVFPSVTRKWPFQDHPLSTVITSPHWSSVSRTPENQCEGFHVHLSNWVSNHASTYKSISPQPFHYMAIQTRHICPYLPKYNQLQQLVHILLTNMCQKQVNLSHATHTRYFMCRYETPMSVYITHMNSLQSIMWPPALVYIHFRLLACALNKYAWHIKQICCNALVM